MDTPKACHLNSAKRIAVTRYKSMTISADPCTKLFPSVIRSYRCAPAFKLHAGNIIAQFRAWHKVDSIVGASRAISCQKPLNEGEFKGFLRATLCLARILSEKQDSERAKD